MTHPKKVASHNLYLLLYTNKESICIESFSFLIRKRATKQTNNSRKGSNRRERNQKSNTINRAGYWGKTKQNKTKTNIFILLNYPGENMSELHPKIELLQGRKFVKPCPITLQLHVEQSWFWCRLITLIKTQHLFKVTAERYEPETAAMIQASCAQAW